MNIQRAHGATFKPVGRHGQLALAGAAGARIEISRAMFL
jgi:hypothetical protein